ncbi:MAG: reactive intermediate/imine deaminase [Flavobacteriaceae bacterium]|nr:reactive intermediate/imine deaminase [Flavobacteriaceae bacterium]|tara:strand:+ start:7423 stop:7875 length:453 start_codon:yes stop_codon:yes gene_type:complete
MKFLKSFFILTFLITAISCQKEVKSKPQFIKSQYEARHTAPFSDATTYKDLLFLTGQIGKDHKAGKMVEGGIKAETQQVLTNIKDVLEANGSDLKHVLKCTVILSDIDDFSEMNEVYRTFFTENKPARTTFAANLVAGAKIEIEVIAVKK